MVVRAGYNTSTWVFESGGFDYSMTPCPTYIRCVVLIHLLLICFISNSITRIEREILSPKQIASKNLYICKSTAVTRISKRIRTMPKKYMC